MKYIIMAGGPGLRWKNYKNVPKHLAEVSDESLLFRIIRQLKNNKVKNEDISITSNNQLYDFVGIKRNELIYDTKMYNMFYYKALDDEVTFLYGDTFYSDEVIKDIVDTQTDDILFFGTSESIIAIKVINHSKFKKHVEELHDFNEGRAGWAIYRQVNHLSEDSFELCDNYILEKNYVVNVNTADDYEKLVEHVMKEK